MVNYKQQSRATIYFNISKTHLPSVRAHKQFESQRTDMKSSSVKSLGTLATHNGAGASSINYSRAGSIQNHLTKIETMHGKLLSRIQTFVASFLTNNADYISLKSPSKLVMNQVI